MREVKYYTSGLHNIFDTHAHLYDGRFVEEGISPDDVLRRASEAGVNRILIPADSIESSKAAIDYVKQHDGKYDVSLYASVGIHPHEASSFNSDAEKQIYEWLDGNRKARKVLALGEIGLDYYYDLSPRDVQCQVYRRQLEIAYEMDVPIILHEREATGDSMDILREFYRKGNLRKNVGVCHCCSASPEIARELVKMGFYIGFDGPITFKNNKNTPLVCEAVPQDRIVIETDSPYLTPVPNRGAINEPGMVPYVLERIAAIKNIDVSDMAGITTENGLSLYEIQEKRVNI